MKKTKNSLFSTCYRNLETRKEHLMRSSKAWVMTLEREKLLINDDTHVARANTSYHSGRPTATLSSLTKVLKFIMENYSVGTFYFHIPSDFLHLALNAQMNASDDEKGKVWRLKGGLSNVLFRRVFVEAWQDWRQKSHRKIGKAQEKKLLWMLNGKAF